MRGLRKADRLDFFVGVTGKTPEAANRVFDGVLSFLRSPSSGLSKGADICAAARQGDASRFPELNGSHALVWVFGKQRELAEALVDRMLTADLGSYRAEVSSADLDAETIKTIRADLSLKHVVPIHDRRPGKDLIIRWVTE
jgi:hypothetical protein